MIKHYAFPRPFVNHLSLLPAERRDELQPVSSGPVRPLNLKIFLTRLRWFALRFSYGTDAPDLHLHCGPRFPYTQPMHILSSDFKVLLVEAAQKAFPELGADELLCLIKVEEPRDVKHGEFACGVAMKLAKRLEKSPQAVAEAILAQLPEDYRLAGAEFVAPGFINLKLSTAFLQESLKSLESGFSVERSGAVSGALTDRPVIVEYPSTNAAKHMGVHHIITTFLGDALANLFVFMGHEVIRINHLGDWGTHFGKLIYAIETWGDKATIEAHPTDECARLYVKFHEEAEKAPELEDKARAIFRALEEGDEERLALWKWIVQISIDDLQKIFKRLGVGLDYTMGESFYLKMADEVLQDGIKKGAFVKGEGGALIFPMGKDATPALIQKSDGTTLYLTRDVATVKYRVETWHPQAILYVVDVAQSLHFVQDFAIARALGYAEDTSLEHIVFGRMSFADRAMSTRKGNILKLTDILDEAVKRAGELAGQKGSELPREELYALAETVGVASVKYGILSQDRIKDIVFDWDKIISLEGNSAPYLLYSYARARGIVVKVGDLPLSGLPKLTEEAELAMVRRMVKFPEALERALIERKPHLVSTALYELCQEFNRFYGSVSVANAGTELEKRARLGIVTAFLSILKSGLAILGIPVLERM